VASPFRVSAHDLKRDDNRVKLDEERQLITLEASEMSKIAKRRLFLA
jgi:hypothetical protein